ncbi:sporulation associated protein [Aspergillus terreus]|uniref:Sporulation associated protein n=1 Tax=Aspergillus terreus TaxID=33178 RepID=A0A5M3YTY9_ASPTE|nr:hypothetical protein ATETN484_0004013600 [Aspergillus terreus]GFF13026.1 sporulation associated protein [Aspergillus terreus]
MPHATENHVSGMDAAPSGPRKLVLCLDGTGNQFQGFERDSNIVKIYQMLEKNTPNQYHYYQPGIGTYVEGQSSSSGFFRFTRRLKSNIITTVDQGVGTTFESHVLAAYRFIMRYYTSGDHIYIFGFSRGAYTARFLAEMIHELGLLSQGNEEMIRFAWDTFSNYQVARTNPDPTPKDEALIKYMKKFHITFCRPRVQVHFLGLFDCVNSVGQFEIPFSRKSHQYLVSPAARHIRHAVSIHERRLKFKPALFLLDPSKTVDLKEVWFAGNHADVGGGWSLAPGQHHLLSDTPLNWMLQEVLHLEGSESKISFHTLNVEDVVERENAFPGKEEPGTTAYDVRRRTNQPHDMLAFNRGVSFIMVLFWWIFEILPLFTRLELEEGRWIPRRLPPNLGAPRDIPRGATIHHSVDEMIRAGILDPESIPPPGGGNSHLPSTDKITGAWKNMRKNLSPPPSPERENAPAGQRKAKRAD